MHAGARSPNLRSSVFICGWLCVPTFLWDSLSGAIFFEFWVKQVMVCRTLPKSLQYTNLWEFTACDSKMVVQIGRMTEMSNPSKSPMIKRLPDREVLPTPEQQAITPHRLQRDLWPFIQIAHLCNLRRQGDIKTRLAAPSHLDFNAHGMVILPFPL